jgi:hypothetical protein
VPLRAAGATSPALLRRGPAWPIEAVAGPPSRPTTSEIVKEDGSSGPRPGAVVRIPGNQGALRRHTQLDSSSAERLVTAARCLLLVVQATSPRSTLTGIRQLRGWMP